MKSMVNYIYLVYSFFLYSFSVAAPFHVILRVAVAQYGNALKAK